MDRDILITGLLGSGKSAVSDLLRNKHYTVIDCDTEIKKLYSKPEVFHYIVRQAGKNVVSDFGTLNLNEMRKFIESGTEAKAIVMDYLINIFAENLSEKYKSSDSVIFVEAAAIPEINALRFALPLHDMIIVHCNEETRHTRLLARQNYVPNMTLEQMQSLENLNGYGANHAVVHINNDGTLDDLNDKLMKILESDLGITHKEKLAVYMDFLKLAPNYCHTNAWCYSFFNLGGCKNCPFPCANQDKYYEKFK